MSNAALATPPLAPAAGAAPGLPDVNAEIYPYDVVQHLLDETANFSLFALPDEDFGLDASLNPQSPEDWFGLNGGYGVAVRSRLHGFDCGVEMRQGSLANQGLGRALGWFEARWLFGTEQSAWAPGTHPPPQLFDPWRSQRLVMVDGGFRFGGGEETAAGYGIGRTYPQVVGGRPRVLVGLVGNVTAGSGKFGGLEGTFVLAGELTAGLGFRGNVVLRMVDPERRMCRSEELPRMSGGPAFAPGATYLVMRGVKKDRFVKTTYGPPPDARRVNLMTPSQFRAVDLRTALDHGAPRTQMLVGPVKATMDASVFFDLLAPPGSAAHPVPFATEELYRFSDRDGRETATVNAGITDGVSFQLRFPAAPGQPGVRFAGFGPITGGSGLLTGARGVLTVNSLIGISPHALSLVHTLFLLDEAHQGARPGAE